MGTEQAYVRPVDFHDPGDVHLYLEQLNAYAKDPMGDGSPLPEATLERVARDLATRPGTYCLLAFSDDQCVGFATCFGGYSTYQAKPLLNIHDIAVLPAWRGHGIADRLIEGVTEQARILGCCRVTLEVREDNPRARRVYERCGFTPALCGIAMTRDL